MPFEVSEITSFEDFKSVQEALMGGFADPYFPYWELLKGPTEDGCMTTLWHAKEAMPNSHWIKVWDPSTGEVAGAANWLINESDPYENIVMVPRAGWWPADDHRRDIANQMLQQFYLSRPTRQDRPHVLLNIMSIAPKYRRKGFGKQLVDWGTRKADELGVESFVEGTKLGQLLYVKCGFVKVGTVDTYAENRGGNAAWAEVYNKVAPKGDQATIMWRPVGGKYVEGETKYSWEK